MAGSLTNTAIRRLDQPPPAGRLTLAACADRHALGQRLAAAGLADAADAKARLFQQAADALGASAGLDADVTVAAIFVPGRIELVGKHVDYAGGRSLVCAVDRGFCLLVRARNDRTVNLIRADGGGRAQFELDPDLVPDPAGWTNYPMTVARRVARNFPDATRGGDIAFASDLPPASGLSSSSALVTAMFFALARANELHASDTFQRDLPDLPALAGYLGCIENGNGFANLPGDRGVGTLGGCQDHAAIIASEAGTLTQFAYGPVRIERRIPLPERLGLVVAFSGTHAEKTGSARTQYNDAASLARAALERCNKALSRDDPHLGATLRHVPPQRIREMLADAPKLLQRFEHFHAESARIVPGVGDALLAGDLHRLGRLVDRSQQLAERQLANQVPQTISLARSARELGAVAASAFGAGFGGSVWALVPRTDIDRFISAWQREHVRAHPADAADAIFFSTAAGPPAFELTAG